LFVFFVCFLFDMFGNMTLGLFVLGPGLLEAQKWALELEQRIHKKAKREKDNRPLVTLQIPRRFIYLTSPLITRRAAHAVHHQFGIYAHLR